MFIYVNKFLDIPKYAKEVSMGLGCGIIEIEIKVTETLAELCKNESARPVLSNNETIIPIIKLLSSTTEAQIQACRAIGNICYDNS
jgi:hypothetical protein